VCYVVLYGHDATLHATKRAARPGKDTISNIPVSSYVCLLRVQFPGSIGQMKRFRVGGDYYRRPILAQDSEAVEIQSAGG
jgi:hypothetical protein